MKDFKARTFPEPDLFPLQLKHKSKVEIGLEEATAEDEEKKKKKGAMSEHIIDLIRFLHGSQMQKQKAIEDFHQKFPDCAKKTIDKKISSLFVKEKLDGEPKVRWFASEDTLIEYKLKDSQELNEISKIRLEEMV